MIIHNVLYDACHCVEGITTQMTQEHAVLVVFYHVTPNLSSVKALKAIITQPANILAFSVSVDMTLDILI